MHTEPEYAIGVLRGTPGVQCSVSFASFQGTTGLGKLTLTATYPGGGHSAQFWPALFVPILLVYAGLLFTADRKWRWLVPLAKVAGLFAVIALMSCGGGGGGSRRDPKRVTYTLHFGAKIGDTANLTATGTFQVTVMPSRR